MDGRNTDKSSWYDCANQPYLSSSLETCTPYSFNPYTLHHFLSESAFQQQLLTDGVVQVWPMQNLDVVSKDLRARLGSTVQFLGTVEMYGLLDDDVCFCYGRWQRVFPSALWLSQVHWCRVGTSVWVSCCIFCVHVQQVREGCLAGVCTLGGRSNKKFSVPNHNCCWPPLSPLNKSERFTSKHRFLIQPCVFFWPLYPGFCRSSTAASKTHKTKQKKLSTPLFLHWLVRGFQMLDSSNLTHLLKT